jgi:hypothetical protein
VPFDPDEIEGVVCRPGDDDCEWHEPEADRLLGRLRDLAAIPAGHGSLDSEQIAELASTFRRLDDWLCSGYPPPAEWEDAGTEFYEPAEPYDVAEDVPVLDRYL